MIARLLFLVVTLAALVTWLSWPDAPSSPREEVEPAPAAANESDFDPLLPPESSPESPASPESTARTSATPGATSGRSIVATPGERGRQEGVLDVRIEDVDPTSRWMVHVEDVRTGKQRPTSAPALKGVARIEALPLGGNYEVLALDESWREPARRARVEGPREPGQVVDVTLRAPLPVEISARIVDEQRVPVASTPVETLIVHGDHARVGQEWSLATTDAEGRVVVRLAHPEGSASTRALWVRTAVAGRDRRSGSIDLRDPLSRGRTVVGDVRVLPEPLLASGRVVDIDGRATGERGQVTALVVGKDGSVFAPNPPLVGRFGRDGSFAIHGFTPAAELVLRSTREGDVRSNSLVEEGDVRVPIGARDVTLRYVQPGTITGSIRLDAAATYDPVVVRVAREGEEELVSIHTAPDGAFGTSSLSPGLYRVWATAAHDWMNPLFDVHDVVVAAGETARDPRLANVDLRGRLRRVSIVFDRAANLVAMPGRCRLTRRDTATTWVREFQGPSFDLTLTEATYDLEIEYGEFAPVRLIDVRGEQHLQLRRGRALVLRMVDPENVPPARTALLRASLRPDGDEGELPSREVWVTERRTRVANLMPGRWCMRLELVRRTSGRDTPVSPIHLGHDIVIDVPDQGDVEFALDLDEIAVLEALARLGD